MSEELKPCLCGGKAEMTGPWISRKNKRIVQEYAAECVNCKTFGDFFNTEDEAAAAWNRRVNCE